MLFYMKKEDYKKCKDFAEKVYPTLHYLRNRNQRNEKTIKNQIITGKLGEIGVYRYFISKNIECTLPDFEVTTKKSYNADLKIKGDIPCHVKSQSIESAKRYGTSWTFQYGNIYGYNPDKEIFLSENPVDIVVFTIVSDDVVNIKSIISLRDLLKKCKFSDPKLKHLKGIKKVIYANDIPKKYIIE